MKWKDRTTGWYLLRNVKRTGRLPEYPWEGEEYWRGLWETRTWTDTGAWDGCSPSSHDLIPATDAPTFKESEGSCDTFCTICEQYEPVDADGLCPHCVERLNKLGYFRNQQALDVHERLGTLIGRLHSIADTAEGKV